MRNNAIALLESGLVPSVDLKISNCMQYTRMDHISESARQRLGYVPQKVIVNEDPEINETYMIEFDGNLERLMVDQAMDIKEAVEAVAECNNISPSSCTVIFRDSATDKLNLESVLNDENLGFSVARY